MGARVKWILRCEIRGSPCVDILLYSIEYINCSEDLGCMLQGLIDFPPCYSIIPKPKVGKYSALLRPY